MDVDWERGWEWATLWFGSRCIVLCAQVALMWNLTLRASGHANDILRDVAGSRASLHILFRLLGVPWLCTQQEA